MTDCNATPKHKFKEYQLCSAAVERPGRKLCEGTALTDLGDAVSTENVIVCPKCNGIQYFFPDSPMHEGDIEQGRAGFTSLV